MQIQINKEIRDYYESMLFGLSVRQFFFSLIAVATSVITYFVSFERFGNEAHHGCVLLYHCHSLPLDMSSTMICILNH